MWNVASGTGIRGRSDDRKAGLAAGKAANDDVQTMPRGAMQRLNANSKSFNR
jgi:hypothetical protein